MNKKARLNKEKISYWRWLYNLLREIPIIILVVIIFPITEIFIGVFLCSMCSFVLLHQSLFYFALSELIGFLLISHGYYRMEHFFDC